MIIQTQDERARLIEGGARLGLILEKLVTKILPGTLFEHINDDAEELIRNGGDKPAFLGYTPSGMNRAFPATLCVSVNDEAVHGIPNESHRIFQKGDLVSLDLGLIHKGIVVDSAITVYVGEPDKITRALMEYTACALEAGIAAAQPNAHVGDISHAIETSLNGSNFSIVTMLGGHGVGAKVHEEPFIANSGRAGSGEKLVSGMVIALEPIVSEKKPSVILDKNGYTYRTKDSSRVAHFEHTILIEHNGPVVITRRPSEKYGL